MNQLSNEMLLLFQQNLQQTISPSTSSLPTSSSPSSPSTSTPSIIPTLLKLGWHTVGTYQKIDNTGGSNGGLIRLSPQCHWKCNLGFKDSFDFLEQFKKKYPKVSYADLYTLSSVIAIKAMGGPEIPWRRGRVDYETISEMNSSSSITEDRLPCPDCGNHLANVKQIREIFERIGGLSEKEMVALLGAHTVGRCHVEASGYWGPWTNAETTFSNEYFRLLLEEKWTPKKTHEGKVLIRLHFPFYLLTSLST